MKQTNLISLLWLFFLTTIPVLCSAENVQSPSTATPLSISMFDGANQDGGGWIPLKFSLKEEFRGGEDGFGLSSESENLQDDHTGLLRVSRLKDSEKSSESDEAEEPIDTIADPLEPINRIFFHFNDKLYFWFFKPAGIGYGAVVPRPVRSCVRSFFHNLLFPVRFVNCLLQAKVERACLELTRFCFNTTVGLAGFFDLAETKLDIKRYDEDLGQTFGVYGMGPAFYINWPFLGASSLRDTFGMAGDSFVDPLNYLVPRTKYNVSVRVYKAVNKTSLTIGDYEELKEAALDPYIAVRDAYYQYRKNKIKE